jgi:hypothetical protein
MAHADGNQLGGFTCNRCYGWRGSINWRLGGNHDGLCNPTQSWGVGVAQFSAATVAGGVTSVILGGTFQNGAATAAYGYLFNAVSSWQMAEIAKAEAMAEAGYLVERNVAIQFSKHASEATIYGVADFIAVKGGEVVIGEVKTGLFAKLSTAQKALLSDGALANVRITSIPRAEALVLRAGVTLASQLSVGARIQFALLGELGGRAGGQFAVRAGLRAATILLSMPVMMITYTRTLD